LCCKFSLVCPHLCFSYAPSHLAVFCLFFRKFCVLVSFFLLYHFVSPDLTLVLFCVIRFFFVILMGFFFFFFFFSVKVGFVVRTWSEGVCLLPLPPAIFHPFFAGDAVEFIVPIIGFLDRLPVAYGFIDFLSSPSC